MLTLVTYLIGSVKEAEAVTNAERVDIVGEAALGKFVRLDVIQAHNGVRHDAAMPISAVAFVTLATKITFKKK